MKKIGLYLMILVAGLTITRNANAKIWRVNNNPGKSCNFTTLTAALRSSQVSAGDTLHIEGSVTEYGKDAQTAANCDTINKKLIIIGPGYLLSNNSETQHNKESAKVRTLYITQAASGTIIAGIEQVAPASLSGYSIGGTRIYLNYAETRVAQIWGDNPAAYKIRIDADNITVSHSKLYYVDIYNTNNNLSNITITKCLFNPGLIGVSGTKTVTNLIISNNYFRNDYNPQYATTYWMSNINHYNVIDLKGPSITPAANPTSWITVWDAHPWPVVQPTIQNNTFYAYFNLAVKSARLYNNLFFPKQSESYKYLYGLPVWVGTAEHDAKNNIIYNGTMWSVPSAQIAGGEYAKSYGNMLSDGVNSYNNLAETSWFVSSTSLPNLDKSFVLSSGSPAGDPTTTSQRGMFGGLSPYVLSGLYTIPAVWSISIPSYPSGEVPSTGFEVQVKVKSH